MYFAEIKNDLIAGTTTYSGTLLRLLKNRKSELNDESVVKNIFLAKKDAYDFIQDLNRYGY